jgi:DNA-binding HxlR family transcriptional regulator
LRYRELERKVVGITATMLTKCLRELEHDKFITRKQYSTIPPTVEYSLAERGKTLIPALESIYQWADEQMRN